jgi:hypothetical protein
MGTTGTSKDRLADKIRGGITVAASTGDELRPLRSRDPGCWTDTDRQRKQDGTWSFGAKECGGSSNGASKAVVNADGDNGPNVCTSLCECRIRECFNQRVSGITKYVAIYDPRDARFVGIYETTSCSSFNLHRSYRIILRNKVAKGMLASHGFSLTSQADGQIGKGIRNMTPLALGPPAELTYRELKTK